MKNEKVVNDTFCPNFYFLLISQLASDMTSNSLTCLNFTPRFLDISNIKYPRNME